MKRNGEAEQNERKNGTLKSVRTKVEGRTHSTWQKKRQKRG
jgi:hypothetical protein